MRLACLLVALGACLRLMQAQEPDAWDFVPGEKILLFDDYTDMPRGGAPSHWKVRGATMRVVDGRLDASTGETTLWPNVVKWPNNFTIEWELDVKPFSNQDVPPRDLHWTFLEGEDAWRMHAVFSINAASKDCGLMLEIADPGENQRANCRVQTDKPNKFAIWSQDGRLRVYVNGERITDLNQVKFRFDRVSLRFAPSEHPVALGPVRIAESAPDFSQTILASGRYVSHGILFEVNSNQIKPESKPRIATDRGCAGSATYAEDTRRGPHRFEWRRGEECGVVETPRGVRQGIANRTRNRC